MSEVVIQCKYIISGEECNKIIKNGSIIIEDNKIIHVGKIDEMKKYVTGHDKIDRMNHVAIPAFINAHTHLPETLLRGICDSSKLIEWLYDYVWPFESHMTVEDAYYGASLGALELIESGVAGFIDQYFFVESIEKVVKESKLRALLCPSLFDGTPETGSIEDTWNHIKKFLHSRNNIIKEKDSLLKYGIGPHAPYTVPKEYLLKVSEIAEKYNIPIHIHISETEKEVSDFRKQHQLTPLEYLENLSLLKNKILAAHCVYPSGRDYEIMKKYKVTVLHNPQSNLKLSSGIAPVFKYIEKNIDVVVGTDGNASNNNLDVLEEVRTAALLQKFLAKDPTVLQNYTALKIGTTAGSKIFGLEKAGIIENAIADITLFSLSGAHSWPQNDIISNVLYSASSGDVNDLIVNGNFLYLNREHQTLNKERIIEKSTKIAERILCEIRK